jgi:N-acetylmuramoyl-L-alanine amidase
MLHLPPRHGRACTLLACFAIATATLLAQTDGHHVTAVRFWSLGDTTRIAVETDGAFRVQSDRLTNPDRIFFDLPGTKPSLGSKTVTVIPVADRFVRQIRVAESRPNVTRVVLDLSGTAEASTSRLDNPSRLIIELHTPGKAVAAETASVPKETVYLPANKSATKQFNPPPSTPSSPPAKRPQEPMLEPPPLVEAQTPASTSVASISAKVSPVPVRSSVNSTLAKPTAPPLAGTAIPTVTVPSPAENALPAKRNSSGDRSMIRVLGLKVGRIVIDPGHGGHDTGTIGPEGLREKDLVLDVAKRLGALIEDRLGSEVILTRSDDTFIALERRTEIANEAKADLFLSIHANSSAVRSAAGVETYYLNFTTSRAAIELAARENSGSEKTIYELQDLLEKIALKDKVEESREFASRIQTSLFALSAKNNARAKDRGVRKAPFVVLIGAQMPSVLAEIGFISNPHDENIMKRGDYRERIAEALYKGLSGYASTLSHFQVAQQRHN